jgi:biotin operon repressor
MKPNPISDFINGTTIQNTRQAITQQIEAIKCAGQKFKQSSQEFQRAQQQMDTLNEILNNQHKQ